MMEYRKHPKTGDSIGILGIGAGSLGGVSDDEIEDIISKAIDHGINFFDLCAGSGNVYKPFGKTIKGRREKVIFQLHFGAVYNKDGEYGWSRNLNKIKETFAKELEDLGTDYVDYGFLHCVDDFKDIEDLKNNGIIDYVKSLKEKGVLKHIGFSSHTPKVAHKLLDLGFIDMMLFSLNPAYDLEQGDEYGIGTNKERNELLLRCKKEGVGVSVMKPFHGGQLLDASQSPFKVALSKEQCIQYALDRPAVMTVVPGVRNLKDFEQLLKFIDASEEEKDYSVISQFTPAKALGNCVYCNHCLPCPKGLILA